MKRIRVLFFDDRKAELDTVRILLESTLVFEVIGFSDYESTLESAEFADVDVMLIDRNLSLAQNPADRIKSGTGLAHRLRDNRNLDHIPIIVTSRDWGADGLCEMYENDNRFRGIFSLDKDRWGIGANPSGGVHGAGLVAKIASVIHTWGRFAVASSSSLAKSVRENSSYFNWPGERDL